MSRLDLVSGCCHEGNSQWEKGSLGLPGFSSLEIISVGRPSAVNYEQLISDMGAPPTTM